jgi:hypothetical protein
MLCGTRLALRFDLRLSAVRDRLGVAKTRKGKAMNKIEVARLRAERNVLASLLRERSRSNASGVHGNKATKRANTRSASKAKAMREWA